MRVARHAGMQAASRPAATMKPHLKIWLLTCVMSLSHLNVWLLTRVTPLSHLKI